MEGISEPPPTEAGPVHAEDARPGPPTLGVDAASAEARTKVREFMAEATAWSPRAVRGDARPPPTRALIATLGLGKTELILEAALDAPPDTYVNVFTPSHALADEFVARLGRRSPGHGRRVLRVKGREHEGMCRHPREARAAGLLGISVQEVLCGPCPDKAECAYQKLSADTGPGVRVGPHAYLGIERSPFTKAYQAAAAKAAKTASSPPAIINFIDEDPTRSLYREPFVIRVNDLDEDSHLQGYLRGRETEGRLLSRFRDCAGTLRLVLREVEGLPSRTRLLEAGLTDERCREMADLLGRHGRLRTLGGFQETLAAL